jgi:phosphoribosylanthranilate isomerase
MPSGPGVIGDDLIAEIAATVPPAIGTFLLTSLQSVTEIIEQHRFCRTNTIQLCDHLTHGTHRELKDALPGVSLVQVIHVTGAESLDEAEQVAPHVDAILLDSGNQRLAVKELGGTGRTHDWTLSRAIRERIGIPLFLAASLTSKLLPRSRMTKTLLRPWPRTRAPRRRGTRTELEYGLNTRG